MIEFPVRTTPFTSDEFRPAPGSVYIYSPGSEPRTQIGRAWSGIIVTQQDRYSVLIDGPDPAVMSLRDRGPLEAWLQTMSTQIVYLDITGMSYSLWAPFLKTALSVVPKLRIVYVEPADYRRTLSPAGSAEIFDLSQMIEGIDPLLGFARLSVDDEMPYVFVPLLGFEGARVLHFVESLELEGSGISPIIPVPGFRCEYPSLTVVCNREFIEGTECWADFVYAPADDPFAVFRTLKQLHKRNTAALLKVALAGTKPHALGAVLFAILFPGAIELIYDHPISRPDRTSGVDKILIYDLANFALENGTL